MLFVSRVKPDNAVMFFSPKPSPLFLDPISPSVDVVLSETMPLELEKEL